MMVEKEAHHMEGQRGGGDEGVRMKGVLEEGCEARPCRTRAMPQGNAIVKETGRRERSEREQQGPACVRLLIAPKIALDIDI